MGTGVPFIFQIALLLALPLVFAYLIAVAGLAIISLGAAMNIPPLHPRRRQPDPPSVPH
jgi:hypothetical protein